MVRTSVHFLVWLIVIVQGLSLCECKLARFNATMDSDAQMVAASQGTSDASIPEDCQPAGRNEVKSASLPCLSLVPTPIQSTPYADSAVAVPTLIVHSFYLVPDRSNTPPIDDAALPDCAISSRLLPLLI